jgi:S1-C subfamily serine protease
MDRSHSVVAVALALVACACSGAIASDRLVADIADHVGDGVWAVTAEGCGWRFRGSAFAIDSRHLVTNRHVIANDSSPMIRSRNGEVRRGKVIGSNEQPDIAVIEVEKDLPVTLPWAPTKKLKRWEPLIAIGYPVPENEFKASAGQIVSFQGPDGRKEAALANTPIDHGNSGGPGVRADASVAGVVTQMLLRTHLAERVAILFTADTVLPMVADFITRPRRVLSTCGLGPDYIPPVPKSYKITAPPPTPKPVSQLALKTGAPKATLPPPTEDPLANYPQYTEPPTPVCPTGQVVAQIDEMTATEDPSEQGSWIVHMKGRVFNRTTHEIYIHRIDVTIKGDPDVQGSPAPDRQNVDPDGSAAWEFGDVTVHSSEAPNRETTRVDVTWRWTGDEISCATTAPATSTPSPS